MGDKTRVQGQKITEKISIYNKKSGTCTHVPFRVATGACAYLFVVYDSLERGTVPVHHFCHRYMEVLGYTSMFYVKAFRDLML